MQLKVTDYQGGFSDELFGEPQIQERLASGSMPGWLGHKARTPNLDRELERALGYAHKDDGAAAFIVSSFGKDLGDSVAGCRTFEEQKDAIAKAVFDKSTLHEIRDQLRGFGRRQA
jgi:hypothetical protein